MIRSKNREMRAIESLFIQLLRRSYFPALVLLALAGPTLAQYDLKFRPLPGLKVVTASKTSKEGASPSVGIDESMGGAPSSDMITDADQAVYCVITQDLAGNNGSISRDAQKQQDTASGRTPFDGSNKVSPSIRPNGGLDKHSLLREDWRRFDGKLVSKHPFFSGDDPAAAPVPTRMFNWGAAIRQMIVMQAFQHATALAAQEKTRRGLKGSFFSDYWNSIKGLKGWDDGNRFFTNYVAHPMQGATTGFIYIQNHERAKRQKFGESKEYWIDRLKTFAWSAAWSTNWELGPVSQASIGNVGLNGGMGYVDLVITPVVGTTWTITEEAVDRYIIRHSEGKSLTSKILFRSFLNPMRSVANLLRMKAPWHRERDLPY